MGKKGFNLGTPSVEVQSAPETKPVSQQKHQKPNKNKAGQPQIEKKSFFERLKGTFRGVVSELKKVEWPKMKSTKSSVGVLSNTATVLVVTLLFLVLVTAINLGLVALFRLLITNGQG